MQCSSNIPQGVAFPEVLISAPRIVQTDSEEAMGRQNNMETVLKPNHLTFTSKHDDVIYYLPYGSRYHRSKIFSSHGTDHFSFTHISAKLLEPCSFIWRLPEIIQIPSLENTWEPHLSQAGVSHRDTNRRKEVEVKADNLSGVICGSSAGTARRKSTTLQGQAESSRVCRSQMGWIPLYKTQNLYKEIH